jgi:hypothetical protein
MSAPSVELVSMLAVWPVGTPLEMWHAWPLERA